jgi:IseA DL-endopeptidase inhibitor
MIENAAIRQTLRAFLKEAEAAWFKVYDSSFGRRRIVYQGDEYIQLPLRYSTKAKIYAYFRKYWSVSFSKLLLCSLRSVVYKGRVYVILGDPGPLAFVVESARIVSSTSTRMRVRAVLSGDPDGNVVVYFTLFRTSNGYRIFGRTRMKYDYRFDCLK